MKSPEVFEYNGNQITFLNGEGDLMVNATSMAKAFGKQTNHWLATKQAQSLIDSLSAKTGIPGTGLVSVNQGGTNPGTWMHEDLALMFAQWLSPDFYIWCNDRIKELLKHGFTATQPTLDEMVADPDLIIRLATDLKHERAEKELLQQRSDLQIQELQKSAPKVEYYDNVLQSKNTYTATQIAGELDMGVRTFNTMLKKWGVQYKHAGQWELYAKHRGNEYTKTQTATFTRSDGSEDSRTTTVWTEKGRKFIHDLYDQNVNQTP